MSVLCLMKDREDAILPTYSTESQYSIYLPVDITLTPHKVYRIGLGIRMSFPTNYASLIVENGSGMHVLGGLMDSDYRGEVSLLVSTEKEQSFKRGSVVANMMVIEIEHPTIECIENLSDSDTEEECNMSLENK